MKLVVPPTMRSMEVPRRRSQKARVRIAPRTVHSGSAPSAAVRGAVSVLVAVASWSFGEGGGISVRVIGRRPESGRRPTSSGRRRTMSGGMSATAAIMMARAMKASRSPAAARAMPMTAGMSAIAPRVPTMVRPMALPRSRMNQLAMTTMTAVSMTATAMARPAPQASQSCQAWSMKASAVIMAARMATPATRSSRAPRRSRMMPTAGVRIAPAMVPMVMAKPDGGGAPAELVAERWGECAEDGVEEGDGGEGGHGDGDGDPPVGGEQAEGAAVEDGGWAAAAFGRGGHWAFPLGLIGEGSGRRAVGGLRREGVIRGVGSADDRGADGRGSEVYGEGAGVVFVGDRSVGGLEPEVGGGGASVLLNGDQGADGRGSEVCGEGAGVVFVGDRSVGGLEPEVGSGGASVLLNGDLGADGRGSEVCGEGAGVVFGGDRSADGLEPEVGSGGASVLLNAIWVRRFATRELGSTEIGARMAGGTRVMGCVP